VVRKIRRIAGGAALIALAAVLAGYGGALHPAGDSLAVFRVPLALLGGLALLIWRPRGAATVAGLAVVALAVLPRLWALSPVQAGPAAQTLGLTVYQKNLLFTLRDPAAVVADIRAHAPDIVTLQEVSARNRAVLAALRADYPYQQYCNFRAVGGTAVLSRWPAVPGSAFCDQGLSGLQVETPAGMVRAMSLHLGWPWPHGQAEQISELTPLLRGLDGPTVIGGDFNAVAWSHALARVEVASGTRRAGHEVATFALPYGGMGVAIDHVLASGAAPGMIEVLDRLASDHRGVLARVAVSP